MAPSSSLTMFHYHPGKVATILNLDKSVVPWTFHWSLSYHFLCLPGPMPGMQNRRSRGDSWTSPTRDGDTQGRLAPQSESPQNRPETPRSSFQSMQSGEEPPWRDHSHPNGHSQSYSLDQVYSGTTDKTHSLQSNPQFFSLAIPPGFSGKAKNSIKCWFCISFPPLLPSLYIHCF